MFPWNRHYTKVYKTWRDWFLCFIIFNVFLDVWNSTVLFFILHVWGVIQKLEVWVTGYNFESWPFKDHSRHVCFKLAYWFQRKFFLKNIFPIGSYVKIKSSHGGHLEFPISKRFTGLVQNHPMIIPAKSQFNWLSGF